MTESIAHEPPETRLLQVVDAVANELRPGRAPRPATLESRLDQDLGFDSLGRVELISRIDDAFDVSLPERVAIEAETPADLLAAIRTAPARAPSGTARRARPTDQRPPPGSGMTVPADALTWPEVLDFHAAERPEAVAIRFHADDGEEPVLTFADLVRGAEAVAGGLRALGVEPGAAVSLMLPSGPDYFRCFAGIWLAGAVPVPIYPPFRPSHIEEHVRRQTGILANCETACLITTDELARVAGLLREQVPSLNAIVTPGALQGERPPRPAATCERTALLQYTSGSTAAPKGVVLSHANLLANVRAIGTGVDVQPNDVTISWLPLYHDMGLIGAWLGSLYHGVPLVLMSPLAFIGRPVRWLEAIHRHRGTITAAPNFAFDLCTRRIRDEDLEGLDLSSLRAVYNGAEPVSPETMQRFIDRFRPHGFRPEAMMPVYGLAENSVALTFPPLGRGPLIDTIDRRNLAVSGDAKPVSPDTEGARRLVACGRPLPLHEVRIVDEADRELADRHEGHIQFRGPSATSGYLRNPEANARLLHGDWLDSGDLGYIAQGDLYITGRVKDIIIKAGRNIYPEELEAAVGAIDGIRAGCVAVFGMRGGAADDSGGEQLVVMAESRKTDATDRERLARSIEALAVDLTGMPADQVVLAPPNTVLKTSSGKIRRDACRQLLERGAVGKQRRPVWRAGAGARAGEHRPQAHPLAPTRRRVTVRLLGLATGRAAGTAGLAMRGHAAVDRASLGGRPGDPAAHGVAGPNTARGARSRACAGRAGRAGRQPFELSRWLRPGRGSAPAGVVRRQERAGSALAGGRHLAPSGSRPGRALRHGAEHRRCAVAGRAGGGRQSPAPVLPRRHVRPDARSPALPHGCLPDRCPAPPAARAGRDHRDAIDASLRGLVPAPRSHRGRHRRADRHASRR